jgi:hypothetical protein
MYNITNSRTIARADFLAPKVVFIDGLPGCGKTLFSSLLSSFNRVEKITYSYETEHICVLKHLDKISADAAHVMIRMQTDLIIYDMMMSRNVNCRPKDLSSVFNYHNPAKYLNRMFQEGDFVIPQRILEEKPILSLTVHNLLCIAEPIFQALRERVVFIEIVRHPLYMLVQQALNNEKMIFNARDFTIYFNYNGIELPWYTAGWEDLFITANPFEKSVLFIEKVGGAMHLTRKYINEAFPGSVLTIPFERFVLEPNDFMNKIAEFTGSEITDTTNQTLSEQNVPRKKYAEGIPLDIYKRCGWQPSKDDLDEVGELQIRWEVARKNMDESVLEKLHRLCVSYEEQYMGGRIIKDNDYNQ